MRNFRLWSGKPVRVVSVDMTADNVIETARDFLNDAGEGESVKDRLRSASKALGIPFGLAKRIRYGEVKNIPTHIFTTMADRYAAVLERKERQMCADLEIYRKKLNAWKSSNA